MQEKKHNSSLFKRLWNLQMVMGFILVGVILVMVALLGLIASSSINEALNTERTDRIQRGAIAADRLDGLILDAFSELELELDRTGLGDFYTQTNLSTVTRILTRSQSQKKYFWAISFIDTNGNTVLTVPKEKQGVSDSVDARSLKKAVDNGNRQVIDVPIQVSTGGPLLLALVSPVKANNGAILGAIVGFVDLSSPPVQKIITAAVYGQTGYTSLLTSDSTVIASSKMEILFKKSHISELINSVLDNRKTIIINTTDADQPSGREVVVLAPMSEVPLVLVFEQDEGEFERPLLAMRRRFFVAGLIVVLVGISGTITTVRLLGKPLRQLSQSATRIAAGDLDSQVPIGGIKEFSELGLAFEDMREKVERRNRELSMMLMIDRTIAQDLPMKDVVEKGLDAILSIMEADAGGLYLVSGGDKLVLSAKREISEQFAEAMKVLRIDEGIAGQAISRRQPVTLDIVEYPTERLAQIVAKEGIKKLISAPLIVGDRVIGAVSVGRKSFRPFSDRDLNLLSSVAAQFGLAYEKARLAEELTRRADRRAAMGRITAAISKTLDVSTIYKTLSDELPKLVEYDRLSVAELKGDLLELSLVSRDYSGYLAQGVTISLENKMFYDVVHEGKPVIRHDLEKEIIQPMDQQLLASGLHSAILIPLVSRDRTFGSLNLGSLQKNKYSVEDLEYLRPVADQLAVALDNARLFRQVETAAGEWRNTFDAMEDGVAILSPDLSIQRVNRAMAEMAGTKPQSLLGQYCYTVFHGRDNPLPECPGMRCIIEKRPCEIIREEPTRGNRWFQMRAYPMLDTDGKVISLVYTIRDITKEKQQHDNIEKVYRVSQLLSTTLNLDTVLDLALREVLPIVGEPVSTACIALLDDKRRQATIVAARGLYSDMLKGFTMQLSNVPDEIAKQLFLELKPWVVKDTAGLPPIIKAIPSVDKFQSFVVLPMVRGNQTVGVLFVGSAKAWAIDLEQIPLLENCTRQVTLAVENAQLYTHMEATLSRRVNELQTLTDVLTIATQRLDLITIMNEALKRAAQSLGVERGSIVVPDASGKKVVVLAVWQQGDAKHIETGMGRELTENPMWQKVLIDGKYLITEDTNLIPDEKRRELLKKLGIRSALIVPLKISGRIIGSIQFNTMNGPRAYSSDEISLAQAIAGHFAYIIENAQLYERTEKERGILQAIIASMREGLVVVDAQRNIAYCNQSAEEILDIQSQNIKGQPVDVFEAVWMGRVNDAEKLRKQFSEIVENHGERPRTEFELLSKGRRRTVETIVFPIRNKQSFWGTGVLFRDITHEHEIDRMKTEFVSIASHELRTPMTVIYGFSELLLRTKTLPREQLEWIERIYKETQRLTSIVDDFLNVARIESGRLILNRVPVSIQSIATQLISQLSSNYRYHSFQRDIPDDFPKVMADADRLTQVLYNLMDNAAKYSPQGGPVVILAKKIGDGKQAIISVSDRGLGIPEEEMPKLFTRFHRIYRPDANTIRGTGLGLSIVKSLVDMMGGRVWAESKVGQGSSFYVTLPLADEMSGEA